MPEATDNQASSDVDVDEEATDVSRAQGSTELADNSKKKRISFNGRYFESWEAAYKEAKAALESNSAGWWTKTNIVVLDEATKELKLSTTCCLMEFGVTNPSLIYL